MNSTPRLHGRLWRDVIAAAMITGTAMLTLFVPKGPGRELSLRALGVLMGLVVVFYANEVPKRLPRKLAARCARQDVRRFTGWALVIGGLAYALAWIVAPFEIAALLAMGFLLAAVLLVLARIWLMPGSGEESP